MQIQSFPPFFSSNGSSASTNSLLLFHTLATVGGGRIRFSLFISSPLSCPCTHTNNVKGGGVCVCTQTIHNTKATHKQVLLHTSIQRHKHLPFSLRFSLELLINCFAFCCSRLFSLYLFRTTIYFILLYIYIFIFNCLHVVVLHVTRIPRLLPLKHRIFFLVFPFFFSCPSFSFLRKTEVIPFFFFYVCACVCVCSELHLLFFLLLLLTSCAFLFSDKNIYE